MAERAHDRTEDAGRGPAKGTDLGDEMGGAPYPSDLAMPDPRLGDRGGDFEGETDPRVNPGAAGRSDAAQPSDEGVASTRGDWGL